MHKVTIRPDFTGTVLNFDGLSRENYEVSQDAELSRIPNTVPFLSCFECRVTSHVAVDHIPYLWLRVICLCFSSFEIQMQLSKFIPTGLIQSDVLFRAQNASNLFSARPLPQTPLGSLQCSPRPLVDRGGDTPAHTPPPRRLQCLNLGVFGASYSVPVFYRRFMVTLVMKL